MKITTDKNGRAFMTINGKRIGIFITTGPWVPGVPAELIKVRPRRKSFFPAAFRSVLTIENNSDGMTDYFEADCIRLMPGHPLYDAARQAA